MLGERHKISNTHIQFFVRVVRMRAHCAEDIFMRFGNGEQARKIFDAAADRKHQTNALLLGAR